MRFVALLAVPLAVLTGTSVMALVGRLGRRRLAAAGVLAAIGVLLLPGVTFVLAKPPALESRRAVERALAWLRRATPDAGDPWDRTASPAWAVLAPWPYGHEVLVVGGRANVASPLISPGDTEGLEDALRFALTSRPSDGEELLARHDVRYVLTTAPSLPTLQRYATVLGLDAGRLATPEGGPTPELLAASAVALHQRAGSATDGESWGFLRLLHDVDGKIRIFERVPGARVTLERLPPGTEAAVRVDLDVAGTPLTWVARGRAGAAGALGIRVPYATQGSPAPGNVTVRGAAVSVAGRVLPLSVPESAVQAGERIGPGTVPDPAALSGVPQS